MTTTLHRPPPIERTPSDTVDPGSQYPVVHAPRAVRSRLAGWLAVHGRTLTFLLPVLAIAGLVQGFNMGGSPQRIDDEGTYTAQAWAVDTLGSLTHYTYWYDHPPLGWLQIAGYAKLTGAFSRYDIAVLAGREAMLVATLISVALVFFLARRLSLRRGTSAVAALVFAVSPLAVQFHRTVYLDNVATPWLLAAFLLASTRRNQLLGFAGAAAAFGIAVLSKETYLLALPFLIWVIWRSAKPETRRYTLSVAASILVLIGFSYLLLAIVKGELLPSTGHVSLLNGVAFQLSSRASSGSILDPASLINKTFAIWWQLDPVIIALGALAAVGGLFVRTLRPYAAMLLFLIVFMFRPGGYLPVPYVIMLLPFASLLIAAVSETLWRARRRSGATVRVPTVLWGVALVAALATAVPVWSTQLRGLLLADLDRTTRQAQQWVDLNVPKDSRLIVDDSMWVDLVRHGFARDNVTWYYKVDTDPAVQALSPNGWRDSDYVVTTDSMRTFSGTFPQVDAAIANSVTVATFGTGTQKVDIRRIDPDGIAAAKTTDSGNAKAAKATGVEVAENPRLTAAVAERTLLRDGRVDPRVNVMLGQLLAGQRVSVAAFPLPAGETAPASRRVLISAVDGASTLGRTAAATAVARAVSSASGMYKPADVRFTERGLLVEFSESTTVPVTSP
ncbi:hypothetical protein GCM10027406_05180 [Leifsonia lichenia]